ncbi:MAG: carboxypeptidase-like regulatory domain-containing protein [Planctomycetota bacterium]|jgi:hypothetical protein
MKLFRNLVCLSLLAVLAGCSGLKGMVYDNQTNAGVAGAHLIFTPVDGDYVKHVHAEYSGEYKIDLPEGQYDITGSAPGYKVYASPVPVAVVGDGYDINDIHMQKK